MTLIADSGSTKTIWTFLKDGVFVKQEVSSGINPYQQDEPEILASMQQVIGQSGRDVRHVFFYGSGVTTGSSDKMERCVRQACPRVEHLEIQNDVLAAARSLCRHEPGIACILGTGSNSCLYDGEKIVENVGGFGFILGDEGSGAVLGKQLLIDFLYKSIPPPLYQKLEQDFNLSMPNILERIYRQPFPNRYMASFAPFVLQHQDEPYIQRLLKQHFRNFFDKKTFCYPDFQNYTYHFVGSIAFHFANFIREVATEYHLQVGRIEKDPMQGLIAFHAAASIQHPKSSI